MATVEETHHRNDIFNIIMLDLCPRNVFVEGRQKVVKLASRTEDDPFLPAYGPGVFSVNCSKPHASPALRVGRNPRPPQMLPSLH